MESVNEDEVMSVHKIISLMAESHSGGMYRFHDPVLAMILSVIEIHAQECLDTAVTYEASYKKTARYTDDQNMRYYRHAAKYLSSMMRRITGGYKRTAIQDKMQRILSSLHGAIENGTEICIGETDKLSSGSNTASSSDVGDTAKPDKSSGKKSTGHRSKIRGERTQ